jgi:predicted PurR-regulated permease PerM
MTTLRLIPVVVIHFITARKRTRRAKSAMLSPHLIGRRVNLNPVWMMFAPFAFGALFGFIGALLAIPVAASLSVFLRFVRHKSLPKAAEV